MTAAEELVDEVDELDRPLRVVTRSLVRAERLRHRCVFVVVRSSAGAVLVHRRADWKDLWPSRWDVAVGGVVGAGEAWEAAAARELAEEVGVEGCDLVELGRGTYDDDEVAEVARTYQVVSDGPFTFADGEVAEVAWVDPGALAEWVADRAMVPDSVALVLPLVLEEVTA